MSDSRNDGPPRAIVEAAARGVGTMWIRAAHEIQAIREAYDQAMDERSRLEWLRKNARKTVASAVRNGLLVRSSECSCQCSSIECDPSAGVVFHHAFGYEKENWLNGQWLCVHCHSSHPVEHEDGFYDWEELQKILLSNFTFEKMWVAGNAVTLEWVAVDGFGDTYVESATRHLVPWNAYASEIDAINEFLASARIVMTNKERDLQRHRDVVANAEKRLLEIKKCST